MIKLKTEGKRYSRKLTEIAQWCRENRHSPITDQHETLAQKIQGHFQHFAVSFNIENLKTFAHGVWRLWRKWLNRRGAPKAISYSKFNEMMGKLGQPKARILHPLWGRPIPNPSLF